jgi:hypothetical protein
MLVIANNIYCIVFRLLMIDTNIYNSKYYLKNGNKVQQCVLKCDYSKNSKNELGLLFVLLKEQFISLIRFWTIPLIILVETSIIG